MELFPDTPEWEELPVFLSPSHLGQKSKFIPESWNILRWERPTRIKFNSCTGELEEATNQL